MNRPLKRLLALAGSIFIGLVGAVAFATPAQAHHTVVKGTACVTSNGDFIVTWKVTNKQSGQRYAQIDALTLTPDGTTLAGLEVGTSIQPDESATGTQLVPAGSTNATLKVDAKWFDPGYPDDVKHVGSTTGEIDLSGDVKPAKFKHTFDGPNGSATVALKENRRVVYNCPDQDFLLVSYYAPDEDFDVPQYVYDSQVGTIDDETHSIELGVKIPPCWTQVDLVFGDEIIDPLIEGGDRYGHRKLGSSGAPGKHSTGTPEHAWYNGPGTEEQKCTTPKADFVDNCDGTVTVHLSNNGDDAKYDAKFTIKAGDFEEEVTVAPGEAAQVSVPAGAGEITVTEYDETTQTDKHVATHTWTRPEDCPPPTLVAESTCTEFILKISNPEGNQSLDAVAKYGDAEKNVTIAPGTTETVTFPAGEHDSVATVTIDGYEELAGLYEKPDNCDLPKTGASTASYIAGGTGFVALGAVLFLFARRHLNRLRRLAA